MIASLRGTIQDISTDNIILEIGGVGFQVYLPAPIREQLKPNQSVSLFTYLVVREDSLTLYGFDTRESKELFGLLLGVSGIGPRLALSVLSTLTPEAIRRAVFHEQAEVFSRVPGVGKKTAQKILLHLQDRVPAEVGLEPVAEFSDVDGEVLNALTALGYSVVEAQAAIQSIPRDTDQDIEVRLRLALQFFSRS
jgi:Holliday junction DNA helicase RuvA